MVLFPATQPLNQESLYEGWLEGVFEDIGVAEPMKVVGLTHGGFRG